MPQTNLGLERSEILDQGELRLKIRQLYTWQFFVGAFIAGFTGFILGVILATFLYLKNIDVAGIKRDHEYLKKQYEMLKQREVINKHMQNYVDESKSMIDWNEKAITSGEEVK